MKIVKLNALQFDNFSSKHKYRNYYQTSMYARVMSKFGYKTKFLGVVNEYNKLIGATLIIYKEVFMKNKIAYAPRGILFNYDEKNQIEELVEKLKDILGKQGFMLLRIDPYIPLSIRDINGNILNFNENGNEMIENLKDTGFSYKGKNLYFETEKPRWEALVTLQKDERELFERLDKRVRNKIRKAENNGLAAEIDPERNLNKLYQYIGKKENKPLAYYKQICESFESDIDIYYAKIKTETYVINSRRNYEKEQEMNAILAEKVQDLNLDPKERNNYITKKMESDRLLTVYKNNLLKATELLKQNPDGITIAGAMILKYDNAAYIIAEGIDESYSPLNAGYLLKWQIIADYNKLGFKYVNLNAVVGDFENKNPKKNKYLGLNESKFGYNSLVTEYIGEFDIVLNAFAYNLYNKMNK